jgi:hypothetical protein
MRGDPDKEARRLDQSLAELEFERKGHLRQNARGVLSDDELDAMLSGLAAQRKELTEQLERARGRRQSIEKLEWAWSMVRYFEADIQRLRLDACSPEDRRRLYQALQLRVTVGQDGTVRLNGVIPEMHVLDFLKDPPDEVWERNPDAPCLLRRRPANPARQTPDDPRVVVTLTSAARSTL